MALTSITEDASGFVLLSDYVPGIMMAAAVGLLILASFITFPGALDNLKNGLICLVVCRVTMIRGCIRKKSAAPAKMVASEMDYQTLAMLCGLFIVVASIREPVWAVYPDRVRIGDPVRLYR